MEQLKTKQAISSRAGIYCRLSKDDEREGMSTSIRTQKMMLEKYCIEQGFKIYDVYMDDGYSGLNFNRPGFNRLLTDIDEGRISIVITKDLSRLGRDYIQTGYYTDIYFNKKNVRYIAVNDGVDTSREDNDIAPFKNILNDLYAKDLSRKVKSAKYQRACSGYYISAQPPYGYKVNPANRNQLMVDEEPADTVKQIFRLAFAGESAMQIAKILTKRKVIIPSVYKARNGDTRFSRYSNNKDPDSIYKWCYQTIQAILNDHVYIGDMVNHKFEIISYKTKERRVIPIDKRIVVENTHEAIVNREDYKRFQDFIKKRYRPQRYNFNNIFKDIVFCLECGHRMTLMMKEKATGTYGLLRCVNHFKNPPICTHFHYIYYDDLYNEVLKKIRKIAKEIDNGELLSNKVRQEIKQKKLDQLETEIKKINNRLKILEKIIRKLYEDFACDLLGTKNYHKMLTGYTKEQQILSQRLYVINTELERKEEYNDGLQKLREVLQLYNGIGKLTGNIICQIVEKIEIGHKVTINKTKHQEIIITYRFIGTTL
jgi:site-specific DNA recombinase